MTDIDVRGPSRRVASVRVLEVMQESNTVQLMGEQAAAAMRLGSRASHMRREIPSKPLEIQS